MNTFKIVGGGVLVFAICFSVLMINMWAFANKLNWMLPILMILDGGITVLIGYWSIFIPSAFFRTE